MKVEEPAPRTPLAALASMQEEEQAAHAAARGLLGGSRFWRRAPGSRADVHAALVEGVPFGALAHLLGQFEATDENDIAKVLGVSTRTLRRQSEKPYQPMPPDLASRTWLLAETLGKATAVFGNREAAERWMSKPAMGLDGQRPIDLLRTMQGAEMVSDFLGRLRWGVYT